MSIKYLEKPRSIKKEREFQVLLGLIEYYIRTGKPVGSNTLKETGFENLSSATIRNYFSNLEEEGFLEQQHTSGGRIPTEKAFQIYAKEVINQSEITASQKKFLQNLKKEEAKEITSYLQEAVEELCKITKCATFISAPRFDQDFIVKIKIMDIDSTRCLCAIVTDFGVIQTEIIHLTTKLNAFKIKRIEEYFQWRLTGHHYPENMEKEEETLAHSIYTELLVRYLISYSTFNDEDIYRTGFSKLLAYPEFHEATVLANSLTILETKRALRFLLKECTAINSIKFWIGSDFIPIINFNPKCTAISIPYYINSQPVGAVGIMGPIRIDYKNQSGILKNFSEIISETLTKNLYKHKISYRHPTNETNFLHQQEKKLLEDKRITREN